MERSRLTTNPPLTFVRFVQTCDVTLRCDREFQQTPDRRVLGDTQREVELLGNLFFQEFQTEPSLPNARSEPLSSTLAWFSLTLLGDLRHCESGSECEVSIYTLHNPQTWQQSCLRFQKNFLRLVGLVDSHL